LGLLVLSIGFVSIELRSVVFASEFLMPKKQQKRWRLWIEYQNIFTPCYCEARCNLCCSMSYQCL